MGSVRCPPLKGVLDRSKKKGQGPLPFLRTENPWGKAMGKIHQHHPGSDFRGVSWLKACLLKLERFAAFAPLLAARHR